MLCKMWHGITYPYRSIEGATVEVWGWTNNHISLDVIVGFVHGSLPRQRRVSLLIALIML